MAFIWHARILALCIRPSLHQDASGSTFDVECIDLYQFHHLSFKLANYMCERKPENAIFKKFQLQIESTHF